MIDEMIDRVAHAIFPSLGDDYPSDFHIQAARRAIEAMREPTDEMVSVGWRLLQGNLRPEEIWPHMIDAALRTDQR